MFPLPLPQYVSSPSGGLAIWSFILSGSLFYTVSRIIYNVWFHPLRSYPGPLLWRATSLPFDLYTWTGAIDFKTRQIHKKYGEVVRINPRVLSYANEQALHDIYSHRPGHQELPKDTAEKLKPPNGIHSMLDADKITHSRYRRLLANAFSDKGLREQEPLIKRYVDLLVARLEENAKAGEVTDMVLWYNLAAFDLIGDLAFGDPFNCLRDRQTHPWVESVFQNVKYSSQWALLKHWGLDFLANQFLDREVVKGRKNNYLYADERISRRIDLGEDRGDFWDRIILKSSDDNKSGDGMTKGEMLSNASLLVLGGSETSATVLSAVTFLLLTHPEVLNRVVTEVRSAFSNTSEISTFSVAQLTYMLAVLDETQRIYPAVLWLAPRVPQNGGSKICGKWVPEGFGVTVHLLSAFHLESNFHRPNEFIPERWLGESRKSGEFASDRRGVLQPFSTGTRNCIGRNLAYAEMRLILAKILFHFDMELSAEKTGNWFDQHAWGGLWDKKPLYVKLSIASR